MGRKPRNEEASTVWQGFRCNKEEKQFINCRAKAEGVSAAEFCRSRSLQEFADFVKRASK